jgi:hypothetical protein
MHPARGSPTLPSRKDHPSVTRLIQRRHLNRRWPSYFRSCVPSGASVWTSFARRRVVRTTSLGSGIAPLISTSGVTSNSAWTSAGSGMSAGQRRPSKAVRAP